MEKTKLDNQSTLMHKVKYACIRHGVRFFRLSVFGCPFPKIQNYKSAAVLAIFSLRLMPRSEIRPWAA